MEEQAKALLALVQQLANGELQRHQSQVQLVQSIELLHGSVTQLCSLLLRVEAKADAILAIP